MGKKGDKQFAKKKIVLKKIVANVRPPPSLSAVVARCAWWDASRTSSSQEQRTDRSLPSSSRRTECSLSVLSSSLVSWPQMTMGNDSRSLGARCVAKMGQKGREALTLPCLAALASVGTLPGYHPVHADTGPGYQEESVSLFSAGGRSAEEGRRRACSSRTQRKD